MKINRKVLKFGFVVVGLLVLLVAGIGAYLFFSMSKAMRDGGYVEDWDDADGTVMLDICYGDKTLNTFDMFVPANMQNADSAALMLFIHGGSWMGGDKADEHYACRRYAKRGAVTVSMNYSLLGKPDNPEASLPMMLSEIGQCISKVVAEAAGRGISLRQMSISGTSAGGHLALLYAMRCGEECALPIRFVAEKVGPVDFDLLFPADSVQFVQLLAQADTDKLNDVKQMFFAMSGKYYVADELSWQLRDSLVKSVSPSFWADSADVPVLAAYGGVDPLVKPSHPAALDDVLTRNGTPHRIIMFPNSGHMLSKDTPQRDSLQQAVTRWMDIYF